MRWWSSSPWSCLPGAAQPSPRSATPRPRAVSTQWILHGKWSVQVGLSQRSQTITSQRRRLQRCAHPRHSAFSLQASPLPLSLPSALTACGHPVQAAGSHHGRCQKPSSLCQSLHDGSPLSGRVAHLNPQCYAVLLLLEHIKLPLHAEVRRAQANRRAKL